MFRFGVVTTCVGCLVWSLRVSAQTAPPAPAPSASATAPSAGASAAPATSGTPATNTAPAASAPVDAAAPNPAAVPAVTAPPPEAQPASPPPPPAQPLVPGAPAPVAGVAAPIAPPSNSPEWRASDPGVILAAERLVGLHSYSYTVKPSGGGDESKGSGTLVNFLATSGSGGQQSFDPYAIPYFSIHGVLKGGVTLGGGIGYMTSSGKYDVTTSDFGGTTTTTSKLPDVSLLLITPRLGVVVPTRGKVAFWLRGGFNYYSLTATQESNDPSVDITSETDETGATLTFDPMLVISPLPHTAILLGPVLDIALSGDSSTKFTGTDAPTDSNLKYDVSFGNFGLVGGLALFL